KFWDRTNRNFTGAADFTLADTGLWSPGPDDFHKGRYVLRPVLDFEAHEALFRDSPELFELDAESSAIDSIATDYDIREELTAGYAMASVDIGDWTVLGGVRIEKTEAEYDAWFVSLPLADLANPATPVSGNT